MNSSINNIFINKPNIVNGVYIITSDSIDDNQNQTNSVFSEKWEEYDKEEISEQKKLFEFQKKWYLDLYGFESEVKFKDFLNSKDLILDAGCGLGYKAKWFAELSPKTQVIGMDFSDSIFYAQKRYNDIANLFFVKGDIADTKYKDSSFDFVSCDQVIHHTEDPFKTMQELTRILKPKNQIALYVYAKKALPRELLDEFFRKETKKISSDEMWKLSSQLTDLGKTLSDLKVNIEVPDMPLLNIKGGVYDIQRFIYWNFIKCFWNEDLGYKTSVSTNFDWYAPSNAERYSKDEFLDMINKSGLSVSFLHSEEACHSGIFNKENISS